MKLQRIEMAGDNWQVSYEAAERLHRSVLAEVRRHTDILRTIQDISAGRQRKVSPH